MDFPLFAVACGEEGSDPLVFHDGRIVRVDEYVASGHLELQDSDLKDVAGLGIRVWRYGMPWRLAEPSPGVYDWTPWDRALEACRRHGLEPVIDLCHFGLPDHYNGFCDTRWVDGFAQYVEAFLDRYPEPRWFTPVNEPGITAMFSARLGMWNDRLATEEDYFVALGNVTLANLEALARIRADRDGWWIGSEGFGCEIVDFGDEAGLTEATAARDLQQAVWDLHLGVTPRGIAARLVDVIDPSVQERISALVGVVPVNRIIAGHDIYPVSVTAYGTRADRPVTIADRVEAYQGAAEAWYERYRVPFWISETSNLGLLVDEGSEWLDALAGSLDSLAEQGLPVRGICWYSRGDQYDWDTALTVPIGNVTEVGLFDADRHPRPVAQAYGALAKRFQDPTS
ncbi:MAG TPA: family 1 glycosylhydrolase [Microthrixaceae bacterium]|nr:family 1 glycosylhydrolase [Microthrixaceae bacterium]